MKLKTTAVVLIAGIFLVSSVYAAGESQKSGGKESGQSGSQQDKGAGSSGGMQGGGQDAAPVTEVVIMEIQEKLNDQGYNVGKPDGKMGASTQKGISDFQKAKGLPQTGKPDPQTMSALGVKGQGSGKGGSSQGQSQSGGSSKGSSQSPGQKGSSSQQGSGSQQSQTQ